MLKNRTDYHVVYKLALELDPDEQIKLVEAVTDHLYGFGMWKDREEMKDIQNYVDTIRKRDSYQPDGRLKTPDEFLHELETWEE